MTLLLISSLAFGGTTTKIDFEALEVKAKAAKPSLKLIVEVKRPQFKPLMPQPGNKVKSARKLETIKID